MSYMLQHPTLQKYRKCSCGFTCRDPAKESTKLDDNQNRKYPSEAVKKALNIKEEQ